MPKDVRSAKPAVWKSIEAISSKVKTFASQNYCLERMSKKLYSDITSAFVNVSTHLW
jgi:hypothetical protein